MRVIVQRIEQVAEDRDCVELSIGDQHVSSEVIENDDGGIVGFNFASPLFDAIMEHAGLGGRFNRDYWQFRRGEYPAFPWDYGECSEDVLQCVLRASGSGIPA